MGRDTKAFSAGFGQGDEIADGGLPEDPVDPPEPMGLKRAGLLVDTLVRWVTDTGAALRRGDLPTLGVMSHAKATPSFSTSRSDSTDPGLVKLSLTVLLCLEGLMLWSWWLAHH